LQRGGRGLTVSNGERGNGERALTRSREQLTGSRVSGEQIARESERVNREQS